MATGATSFCSARWRRRSSTTLRCRWPPTWRSPTPCWPTAPACSASWASPTSGRSSAFAIARGRLASTGRSRCRSTSWNEGSTRRTRRMPSFMLAIRRAGAPAGYMPYKDGVVPWHSAMAATYVHATAPLRRLADRYVVEATLAIANGGPVPDADRPGLSQAARNHGSGRRPQQPDRARRHRPCRNRRASRARRTHVRRRRHRPRRARRAHPVVRASGYRARCGERCGNRRSDEVRLVSADTDRRELRFEPI